MNRYYTGSGKNKVNFGITGDVVWEKRGKPKALKGEKLAGIILNN